MKLIRIHPDDNVAVALRDLKAGEQLSADGLCVTAAEDIARGHKIALREIAEGEAVVKYGNPIGLARADIPAGAWVHVPQRAHRPFRKRGIRILPQKLSAAHGHAPHVPGLPPPGRPCRGEK